MKKLALIPLTLAVCVASAWAQESEKKRESSVMEQPHPQASTQLPAGGSSVTLYGIADGGVNYTSGLRGGSVKQLVSGIMEGSRFGLRGNENLGDGFRAIFTLENRFEIDTGGLSNRPISGGQLPDRLTSAALLGLTSPSPAVRAALQQIVTGTAANLSTLLGVNLVGTDAAQGFGQRFFDRQAYVGLVTPVGAVLGGRQYTPAYEVVAEFDTLQTQSSLAAGQVNAFPPAVEIRTSNALQYRIAKSGFTANLFVAAGEGSTSQGRLYAGFIKYNSANWAVGFAYNTRENQNGAKSLTNYVVGGNVNIGPGTLSGLWVNAKDNNPGGLDSIGAGLRASASTAPFASLVQNAFTAALRQDGDLYHIGYRATFGRHTGYVAYSLYDDKRSFNADTQSYGFVYSYAFSKRTDLNFVATRFNNSGLGQNAPGQAGFIGGFTATAGTGSTNLALGIRHRF